MKKIGVWVIVAVMSLVGMAGAYAQEPKSTPIVTKIEVTGNQRVEVATVRSYLGFKEGDTFDADKVDEAIKAIFATGLFLDLNVVFEDGVIRVELKENPIVNQVAFEGNKRLEDDALAAEVRLVSRSVYTRARVQSDVARIQELYRKNGRFSVDVEPKVIQLEQNRIDVVFEIAEGAKTRVYRVDFIGNSYFRDAKLKEIINTKEYKWFKFFTSGDTYDPDKLAFDKELLRKFYVSKGFADFKVNSTVAEITEDKTAFLVTFMIEEGKKYNFGQVKIKNKVPNLEVEELRESVDTIPDTIYNAELVESTIDKITEKLNDLGYAFVDVDTIYDRDADNQLIDITYDIKEGPKVYVDRINIKGNVRTLDKVVRREFRIAEGDPYNSAHIRRSEQRIKNLGFFSNVKIENKRTQEPDRVDIDVEVEEKSTGELNFGVGFSTTDGALASVSIRERNLLGKGQDLRGSVQKAAKATDYRLGFTEPYFLGRDVAAGFDLFSNTRDRSSESSFDQETRGLSLRTSYSISEHLRHLVKYAIREDRVSDVQDDASTFIKEQSGDNTVSLIGHSFVWDHRDNMFDPSEGYYVRFDQDFAGLGGDSKYIGHELNSSFHYPLYKEDVILGTSVKAGHIYAWEGDVRIDERFFLGGNRFLGFDVGGIGPRDRNTLDSLGGNMYYVGAAEVKFPLGLPEELGVKAAVFANMGSLTGIDQSGDDIVDTGSIRVAAGIGLLWASPFGPVRVNFTEAFVKEDHDKTKTFDVNFGTGF